MKAKDAAVAALAVVAASVAAVTMMVEMVGELIMEAAMEVAQAGRRGRGRTRCHGRVSRGQVVPYIEAHKI